MGFPRLLSIFYCTFHPIQGPKVLYEVPEGSILSKTSPLVDFDSISEYLIPKVELCSKLVTILTPTCKVIGFPINLEHKKFQRNALMFNLAFVFDKDAETSSYEPVVRKMARVLKALEKESEFLSRQTRLAMMGSGALTNPHTISSVPSVPINSHASTAVKAAGQTPVANVQTVGASSAPLETASATALSTDSTDKTSGSTSLSAISNALAAQELSSSGATQPASLPPALPGTVSASQALPAPNSILSSTLMSSPPSLSSGTITSAITGPPSSSPFTQSKPVSTSSTAAAGISTNGTASAPSSQRGMTSLVSLLQQEHADGSGMQNLIEQLIEDLNSYCECQIPIDSANTINLKLFPTYPNPAPVYDYQVPISTVNLEALTDLSWDMTMQRIIGFINGVSSVKRIAQFADVETGLTRMCMQHLLYYGCIIMVDLFQFKNIYAVKLEMMRLTEDLALQHECVSYVTLPDMHAPSFAKIFSLYCSLQYGVVLQDWIEQNQISDFNIDVRRFISFGVIKGFLYRVHKYPILDLHEPTSSALAINSASSSTRPDAAQHAGPAGINLAPASAHVGGPGLIRSSTVPPTQRNTNNETPGSADHTGHLAHHNAGHNDTPSAVVIPPALRRMLNGEHHYDELCTMFGCSVRELDQILITDSRVKFIYR